MLIVFAKYPEAGKCKTRLIGELTAEQAAELHRQMTLHTLQWCRQLQAEAKPLQETQVRVYYTGASQAAMAALYGDEFTYVEQAPGDLGHRLRVAFHDAFTAGAESVLVVGTDCPTLTSPLAQQAFSRLEQNDVCIVPATDGGYVLLGIAGTAVRRDALIDQVAFSDIAWGTETVLEQTVARVIDRGYTLSILASQSDVDRPEDLAVWNAAKAGQSVPSPRISIVVPVLNCEPGLADTLSPLKDLDAIEILLVAAGEVHHSASVAVDMATQLLCVPTGRAAQLNAGAAAAGGEVLVFLHADTRLPRDFAAQIQAAFARPEAIAGAFRLHIDSPHWSSRVVEFGVACRSRLLKMPYGDQAIFVRRTVFEEVGGFSDLPIMEDYELIRRLKSVGKIALCEGSVTTSPRRWHRLGAFRTTLINQLMILGYHLGVSPNRLAAFYRNR